MAIETDRPKTAKRRLTVRELIEGELELIAGGGSAPIASGETGSRPSRTARKDG